MIENELYECKSGVVGFEDLPQDAIQSGRVAFPDVHRDTAQMVEFARAVSETKRDRFACVPFCLTVEAEALGAIINLGNERVGPRVREYAYREMRELLSIENHARLFETGRLSNTLEAVEILSQTHPVILNVNGIFTTVVSLIEINTLFKALRSDRATCDAVLASIKQFLFSFIKMGISKGAKVISYADPVGDITLTGAKMFGDVVAPITCDLLKDTIALLDDRILHLCGRMSSGLVKTGALSVEKNTVHNALNYGDALLKQLEERHIHFVGNRCIKKTGERRRSDFETVYSLSFS